MLKFPAEWEPYFVPSEPTPIQFYGDTLCFDVDQIIKDNLDLREHENGLATLFPNWWKEFFLFGTNGGGDFYAVKLNGEPGVWMIGTDCGDEPNLCEESLGEFLEGSINRPDPTIVPSQSAKTALEKAFLGTWRLSH